MVMDSFEIEVKEDYKKRKAEIKKVQKEEIFVKWTFLSSLTPFTLG